MISLLSGVGGSSSLSPEILATVSADRICRSIKISREKKQLLPSQPRLTLMTIEALSIHEPSVKSLIFLGTGTSSQVPVIGCLTNASSRCKVCPSALHPETRKNRRRNTSALITLSNEKNILIDCGKSFFDAALEIWPRARLRKIDALLLTHNHADALNGLDDLRGWTLGGFIQDSIPIYCSQRTYDSVSETFPYMIDSQKATGGGDIPAFQWHVIDEDAEFYVESCSMTVQALRVEHGRYFDEARTPFICLGFRIADVSYISDASAIPESTKRKIEGSRILVLDALKHGKHASHYSIPEALEFINSLERPALRTYLLDFTHDVDHYTLEADLKSQNLDIAPAYDGLQVNLSDSIRETDLLAEVAWVAVSEVNGTVHDGKVKSMV